MSAALPEVFLPIRDYDLAATLTSGQAFRWEPREEGWEGVIGSRWVRLRPLTDDIHARAAAPVVDWRWLTAYLQTEVDLNRVLATFPDDEPIRAAMAECRGLRLLRQDPWECLASFILSSTKQIVQIRQIVALLCERLGEPVVVPADHEPCFAFPAPQRIAAATEAELRACKMGFRAPNLLASARMIANGTVKLDRLAAMPADEAREQLVGLPGVGRKIADCVLLFACGFPEAFPVDVWVTKALRKLYFPRRRVALKRLQRFAATHFGPQAGYAQQYLFHYMRVHEKSKSSQR
jgi:N-glycosylase/DNA lyase